MDTTVSGEIDFTDDFSTTIGTWSEDKKTITADYTVLTTNHTFNVVISKFKDSYGNEMLANTSYSFTTAKKEPTINPETGEFDLYEFSPDHTVKVVYFDNGDYTFNNLSVNGTSLKVNTDYRINTDNVVIFAAYLKTLPIGINKIVFNFNGLAGGIEYKINIYNSEAPLILNVSPSGNEAELNGNLSITFNNVMDTTKAGVVKLNNAITLNNGVWDSTSFIITYFKSGYKTIMHNNSFVTSCTI